MHDDVRLSGMTRWLFAIAVLAACEGREPVANDEPVCVQTMTPPPAPRVEARPLVVIDSVSGIAECDALLDKFESYARCGALDRNARESMRTAVTQVRENFRQLRESPAEGKRAAALACGQAVDQMKQSARDIGCRL